MEIAEILEQFQHATGVFPQDAVDAAVERREEITPALLAILEDTIEHAEERAKDENLMAHLFALYLLAQFRETRAYPLLLRLVTLPEELVEAICGDFITMDLRRVLASVSGGEVSGIQALIENRNAGEWVRGAALESLLTLVAAGLKGREEIIAYFTELFHGKLERTPSDVWDSLVLGCSLLCAEELRPDIRQAYDDEVADPQMMDLDDVEFHMARGVEGNLAELREDRSYRLVENADEMDWMDGFSGEFDEEDQEEGEEEEPEWSPFNPAEAPDFDEPEEDLEAPPETYVRETPKIGRNAPCPCGSGKKYKKCCGK